MTFALSNYLYYFVWQLSEGELAIYPLVLFFSVVAVFFTLGPLHRRMGKARAGAIATLVSMTAWLIPYALIYLAAWPQLGTSASAAMLFVRSEENTYELKSLMQHSSAVSSLKKK